jgi:hypothetical protein
MQAGSVGLIERPEFAIVVAYVANLGGSVREPENHIAQVKID